MILRNSFYFSPSDISLLKSMNWIKLLNNARYLLFLMFIIVFVIKKFQFIHNYELVKNIMLFDLSSILVLIYLMVYVLQNRLELKEKDKEIEKLKSLLKP